MNTFLFTTKVETASEVKFHEVFPGSQSMKVSTKISRLLDDTTRGSFSSVVSIEFVQKLITIYLVNCVIFLVGDVTDFYDVYKR